MRPAVVAALLLIGCATEPELGAPRTFAQSVQRPLQPDFITPAFAARTQRLAATARRLWDEPERAARLPDTIARIADGEPGRAADVPATAADVATDEAWRLGVLRDDAGPVAGRLLGARGDRPHRRAAAAHLLGVARPPLGEIDDHRHRTDPDDDRPEATLLERVVRRLRL